MTPLEWGLWLLGIWIALYQVGAAHATLAVAERTARPIRAVLWGRP